MHLYISAKVKEVDDKIVFTLTGTNISSVLGKNGNDFYIKYFKSDCRLQLRKEEDMTEEENREYRKKVRVIAMETLKGVTTIDVDTPESIKYKLERGVDCFDLIKSGEADYNPKIYEK